MTLYRENGQYKLTNTFPRNFDSLYNRLFDTYLNWDYSKTTGKYRNQFLGEDKKQTENKQRTNGSIASENSLKA